MKIKVHKGCSLYYEGAPFINLLRPQTVPSELKDITSVPMFEDNISFYCSPSLLVYFVFSIIFSFKIRSDKPSNLQAIGDTDLFFSF